MNVITSCLDSFFQASGSKVSVSETKIFFSKNSNLELSELVCNSYGFERVDLLGKYLGTLILDGRIK